jgi:DNA-binding NarL/FixJ family response regulator
MDIRVLVIEDNKSLRLGLQQLLNESAGFTCAGAYKDYPDLLQHIADTRPDLVLMDIQIRTMRGIESIALLRENFPTLKILIQSVSEDSDRIFQSILSGASGYILKDTTPLRMLDYIKETHEGGAPMSPSVAAKVLRMIATKSPSTKVNTFKLSEREQQILSSLIKGMSYRLIATACFISIDTVRSHIRHIYDKLHVHSKGEAVATAMRNNYY